MHVSCFQLGNGSRRCSGYLVVYLLLSAGWFSSTHILLPWVGQSLSEVYFTLQSLTLPRASIFCWGWWQGCGAAACQEPVRCAGVLFHTPAAPFPPGPWWMVCEAPSLRGGLGSGSRQIAPWFGFCLVLSALCFQRCRSLRYPSIWSSCYWFLAAVALKAWKAPMSAKGKSSHHGPHQGTQIQAPRN